jgi:hypothetical protein
MGLRVWVYRWALADCTNGGISADHSELTVVNVAGPSEPTAQAPAVWLDLRPGLLGMLESRPSNCPCLFPARPNPDTGAWERDPHWWMAGGNFAATCDGRWAAAVGAYGAVAIHDRTEELRKPAGWPA